jgi:hypothetical protein
MVWTQFAENDVQGHGFGPLLMELVNQTSIDLTRPKQPETESQRTICNGFKTVFVDENETEIGIDLGVEKKRFPGPHVKSRSLESLKKLRIGHTKHRSQGDHAEGDQGRHSLEWLQPHARD